MIREHLPALQVVVPLLAAPVCILVRQPRLIWLWTTLASVISLLIAAGLLSQVYELGTLSYALGGWLAPWGIEYRVDTVNSFVLLIVSGISTVVLPFVKTSIKQEIHPDQLPYFYAGWLLCLTGLLGITITGDAFNVFVFLEISSLSSYLLISLGTSRKSLIAAFQYLVVGTIGASFILIAIGLLYMMTGTLNMADLANRLPAVQNTRTVQAAFVFLAVGIAIKAAVFPLHQWLPNAYAYAPSSVSAFLAGSATKVSVYLLLRFFFDVFDMDFSMEVMQLDVVLLVVGIAAMFVMSVVAIFQTDIKRMLACSSVAQIGYMALGVGLVSVTGVSAAILHLFNHAVMKAALFLSLGCVVYRIGSVHLDDMAGLGKQMPWTMAAFVIGGLSLIGIPLTVGFVSKWYLILAALEHGWWWLGILILLSSLLAVAYVWRVVESAYFRPARARGTVREAPLRLLIPTWILVGINVYFGIDTSLSVGTATRAAALLVGSGG